MSSTDDMPPALPAMWRALKRGYQAEPLLLSVSFGLALLAALPDALIALLLKLLADGVLEGRRGLVLAAAVGLGVSAAATWFLRVISDRTQRRFRDRLTIALESHVATAAGVVGHDRAPRTPRVSRSPGRAAQPGLRARSHVHVAVHDLRLDLAAGRDAGPAGVDSPGAGAPGRVCAADGADVDLAAGRGARRRRAGRGGQSPGAASLRPRHDRAAGQGGARDAASAPAWSPSAGQRGSAGTGPSPRPGCKARSGMRWDGRSSAPAYVAAVVFVSSVLKATPGDVLLVLAAGSRLSAYIGGDGGRDRVSARHLARRLDSPGVARRLRRPAGARTPTSRARQR